MIKVLDTAAMQACDRAAIEEYRIPGMLLMENAGLQVLDALAEHFGGAPPQRTAVLCGKGNNGGDGFVIARHLRNLGREVVAYLFGAADELAGDAAANHGIAERVGVATIEVADAEQWRELAGELVHVDCIVDAMLGTGLQSAARGVIAAAIDSVNASGVPVVAVDMPSGLDADSGRLPGAVVAAELTVTFAAPKCCHVLAPACEYCGDLVVGDISIPAAVLEAAPPSLWLAGPDDTAGLLPERVADSHKGNYGSALVVGGAPGTAGAAVLAGEAALRAGSGLVHVACPESVYALVGAQLTEALVHPLPADAGGGLAAEPAGLAPLLEGADAVALGPGLGTAEATVAIVRELAQSAPQPTVIDADGLNALVGVVDSVSAAPAPRILTPHPGEAARLLGCSSADVQADRPQAVRQLCEISQAIVVLKGHRTLTAAPGQPPIVNSTGNAGMATGGTGDVLTGLIVGLLAQGLEPAVAAWFGVYLHGLAGDRAAAVTGETALIAGDLIDALPAALAEAVERDASWE